ncbi:MAG TPA: alpha-amylase family protein [Chryseosolibacter sp.]|nr:alpha-amylase family protein [Chryseosolibacter sp.]
MVKYWYKNAIIYTTHVETFLDGNGDGIGDFRGLTMSLDYLAGLGITCIWLLPFFPTPNRDHGYDVTDYFSVDPRFGNLGHFVEFVDAADERGIRVIIDLVINHTFIDHPWFQEARKDKNSKYRKYYIWLDEKPANPNQDIVFGHHQDGNWEYDQVAGQYYYHTFYKHQADLNIANPQVQEEIKYIIQFWLKLGISGFRMDAVTHILNRKGNEKFDGDPHQFLRDIRSFVEDQRPDAILLAEVDTESSRYRHYFGEGDQVQMLFNFYLNNYLFLALATGEAKPIIKAVKEIPLKSVKEQMATFVRTHDELDLERLSKKERELVYAAFAPDENMRIYGRGIRRRLAPMMNNDRHRIELVYSLLFSLPGTPVLRYGDELGMGEDLSLPERNSVRTAMQWTDETHGGFSSAKRHDIPVPVIEDGEFGYKQINVHKQMRDPGSLLSWIERIIAARKECVEFGFGECKFLKTGNEAVLAHVCHWKNAFSVAFHNLGNSEVAVEVEFAKEEEMHVIECFADKTYDHFQPGQPVKLGPYGYRWFRKSPIFI